MCCEKDSFRTFQEIGYAGEKGAPTSFVVQSRFKRRMSTVMVPKVLVLAKMIEQSYCVFWEGIRSGDLCFSRDRAAFRTC